MIIQEIMYKIIKKSVSIGKRFVSWHYVNKSSKRIIDNDPIKICFLVQMSELWDKEKAIYNALNNDNHFYVELVVIPPYDIVNKRIDTLYTDNYFFETYPQAIRAYRENKWLDIKEKKHDYVFYQRPYNAYLPKEYRSTEVMKYSRCCYIPYAFWPLENFLCGYNEDFYDSVYYAFMESELNAKALQKYGRYKGRILFCGYPQLENQKMHEIGEIKNVLWAPRWAYDDNIGGSHFLEYKDEILDFFTNTEEIRLLIRPHPLAFDNYIAKGLMTYEEVNAYKEKVFNCGAAFDQNRLIEDTFRTVDVLVSDISSIIFPYMTTGKPVIFCDSGIKQSPAFADLVQGFYVAHSFKEVLHYLTKLIDGDDPLKEIRKEIACKIAKENSHSTDRIVSTLLNGIGI